MLILSGLQQAPTQWYQYVQPVCPCVFLIAMDPSLHLLLSPPGHESRFDLCDMVRTQLALLSWLRLHRALQQVPLNSTDCTVCISNHPFSWLSSLPPLSFPFSALLSSQINNSLVTTFSPSVPVLLHLHPNLVFLTLLPRWFWLTRC